MSFAWCLKFAGVVALGGFVTTAESLAQQPTIAEAGLMKSVQRGPETRTKLQPGPLEPLFLPNANQLTLLDKAYLDAFSILKEENTCSAFYGGPQVIQVLNDLKQQLKPKHFDSSVAVRMTGKTRNVTSLRSTLSYRLFDKAELNLEGPFNRDIASHRNKSVGHFLSNTREGRVTILLHELGHLIAQRARQWLLPDDGTSEDLSQENTKRVIAMCDKQIRDLNQISFAQELQAARSTSPSQGTEVKVVVP